MRFSPLVDRISGKGAGAWSLHMEAARLRDLGHDVIFLTVGDPDQAPPAPVIDATIDALRRHRTGYSSIVGYPAVRTAIAARVPTAVRVRVHRGQRCCYTWCAGRGFFCAAVPGRPRRRSHRPGADLQHLRGGDRSERCSPRYGAVTR